MHDHQQIDRRSLALRRKVVERIREQPSLYDVARENIARWKTRFSPCPPAILEWETILATWPMERVLETLVADTEEAARLRQNDPFAGVLNEEERLAAMESHDPERA